MQIPGSHPGSAQFYRIIERRPEKRLPNNPEACWKLRTFVLSALEPAARLPPTSDKHGLGATKLHALKLRSSRPSSLGDQTRPHSPTPWALHEHRYHGRGKKDKGSNPSCAFRSSVASASSLTLWLLISSSMKWGRPQLHVRIKGNSAHRLQETLLKGQWHEHLQCLVSNPALWVPTAHL